MHAHTRVYMHTHTHTVERAPKDIYGCACVSAFMYLLSGDIHTIMNTHIHTITIT